MTLPATGDTPMDGAMTESKSDGCNPCQSSHDTPKPIKSESSTVSPEDVAPSKSTESSAVDALVEDQKSPMAKPVTADVNGSSSSDPLEHTSTVVQEKKAISPTLLSTTEEAVLSLNPEFHQTMDTVSDEKQVGITKKSPEDSQVLDERTTLEKRDNKMEEVVDSKAQINSDEPKSSSTTVSKEGVTKAEDSTKLSSVSEAPTATVPGNTSPVNDQMATSTNKKETGIPSALVSEKSVHSGESFEMKDSSAKMDEPPSAEQDASKPTDGGNANDKDAVPSPEKLAPSNDVHTKNSNIEPTTKQHESKVAGVHKEETVPSTTLPEKPLPQQNSSDLEMKDSNVKIDETTVGQEEFKPTDKMDESMMKVKTSPAATSEKPTHSAEKAETKDSNAKATVKHDESKPTDDKADSSAVEKEAALCVSSVKPAPQQTRGDDVEMKDSNVKMEEPTCTAKRDESMPADDKTGEPVIEEEDEESTTLTELTELMEVLGGIETPGSTCAAGPATCLPSVPGLCVDGVGDIPLPISDAQAIALASVAEQAPHGKGLETVVDKSVRNTLQVDPSKVTLQNPAWEASLRSLVQHAAESLGVSPSLVRAELYKLLLYEPGGFFKKHRDTEKAQGMFATLVVQLPSKFTGGSFVVSHGGESQTFALGAGKEAAFGCHFVCHYADCEHEIKKVESGHRLALIYSLCYTGPGRPSAADVGHNYLSTILKGLPPDETMFVIPLEHQYTTASLARLGAGALKGADRAKQNAIEVAGKGDWKTVVAQVERTDHESGEGNEYYGGFDVYDVERGDIYISDGYHADGSDAADHLRWIRKQISFESVEDGGMMMVSTEDLEEDEGTIVWGEGDSGSVEYTGNEGATRETTYSTYVLIAYSEKTAFERMCASEFSSAVSHVLQEKSADLMRRILSYMKDKCVSISHGDAVRLLQALDDKTTSEEKSLFAFETIVDALSRNCGEMPSAELTNALISYVERFGWTRAAVPIKSLVTKLVARKDLTTTDFLKQVDFLLMIQGASDCRDFDGIIGESIKNFDSQTRNPPTTSGYGSYGYNMRYNSSAQASADALVSLSQRHPREKSKPVVHACIVRMTKQEGTGVDKLYQRASLLQRLRQFHDSNDIVSWFHDVVVAFVSAVEKLPHTTPSQMRYGYGASSDVLSSNHADELFRRLFEFGAGSDIMRVKHWTMNAQVDQLSKLEKILKRLITPANLATTFRDSTAVHELVQSVQSRIKTLQLSELLAKHQKLIAATQRGEPVFSWTMPQARTSNPALTAFLRSPRTGPETIVVGGGINHARAMAGTYRYSRYSYSSNSRNSDPVKQGYSATIQATSATGRNAAICVTKTRALHDALVKKYSADVAELAKTREAIRSLGGSVAVPTTNVTIPSVPTAGATNAAAAAAAVVNIEATETLPNPAKKRRVKAPIPDDVEIVEIE